MKAKRWCSYCSDITACKSQPVFVLISHNTEGQKPNLLLEVNGSRRACRIYSVLSNKHQQGATHIAEALLVYRHLIGQHDDTHCFLFDLSSSHVWLSCWKCCALCSHFPHQIFWFNWKSVDGLMQWNSEGLVLYFHVIFSRCTVNTVKSE